MLLKQSKLTYGLAMSGKDPSWGWRARGANAGGEGHAAFMLGARGRVRSAEAEDEGHAGLMLRARGRDGQI